MTRPGRRPSGPPYLHSVYFHVLDHASTSFQFKIKEVIHIQKDQTSLNQQLHHFNLKLDALRALTRASYRSTKSYFTSSSKGIECNKHK